MSYYHYPPPTYATGSDVVQALVGGLVMISLIITGTIIVGVIAAGAATAGGIGAAIASATRHEFPPGKGGSQTSSPRR